jgi:hypothetical protein
MGICLHYPNIADHPEYIGFRSDFLIFGTPAALCNKNHAEHLNLESLKETSCHSLELSGINPMSALRFRSFVEIR